MRGRRERVVAVALALGLALAAAGPLRADAALTAYDDALQSGFADWSWATRDLAQTGTVHSGSAAISFEPDGWEGLYLHRDAGMDVAELGALELWVRGAGAGDQRLTVALLAGGQIAGSAPLEGFVDGGRVPAGSWAKATVPFSALGVTTGVLDGFWLQDASGGDQPTVFLDDIRVLDQTAPPPPAGKVTVHVDRGADRCPVSPLIYGVSYASPSALARVGYPLQRWGGNATTRYSWQDDISNRASDWFFYNLPEDNPVPQNLPHGSAADRFVDVARAAGAEPLVTVPLIGWTPRDRERRWGFSVAKYGAQQQTECTVTGNAPWCNPDAGNGLRPDGTPITGNDPTDTSRPIDPSFVTGWLAHLASRTGTAAQGGVKLFALDNEPMLWSSTHRDVHPDPTTFDEIWQRTLEYAAAMKQNDPAVQILGPVVWGWCAYFGSAADNCTDGPDRQSHGGLPFLEWYLAQVAAHEQATGVRLVDYLDVHYYPQAPGVALSDDESAATAARRLRSLRSLHDPSYVDESWIGVPVRLIPRMKEWIAARAPGTKLAITEYNFGGDDGPSSALAHAEALAIFGREGVDLAARWVAPSEHSRVEDAFRLYLDYDGAGARVSGTSVRATSDASDAVGAYAVERGDGRLYVLLFNRDTAARDVSASIDGAGDGSAALYRFAAAAPLGPIGSAPVVAGSLDLSLPARSATLAVVDASPTAPGCTPLTVKSLALRRAPERAAKVVMRTTFTTAAAVDPVETGLGFRLVAAGAVVAEGQLGGPGAAVRFVRRGTRAIYTDRAGSVAGVEVAKLLPGGGTLPDGRRKWTAYLRIRGAGGFAGEPPATPALAVRLDAGPLCAATQDDRVACRWHDQGRLLRCRAVKDDLPPP